MPASVGFRRACTCMCTCKHRMPVRERAVSAARGVSESAQLPSPPQLRSPLYAASKRPLFLFFRSSTPDESMHAQRGREPFLLRPRLHAPPSPSLTRAFSSAPVACGGSILPFLQRVCRVSFAPHTPRLCALHWLRAQCAYRCVRRANAPFSPSVADLDAWHTSTARSCATLTCCLRLPPPAAGCASARGVCYGRVGPRARAPRLAPRI